jgi:O-antigen/teichoic acid export membrane protein
MIPVLIRLLGLDGFGIWTLLEPILLLGTAMAFLGADHGVIKQVAHDGAVMRDAAGALLVTGLVALAFTGAAVGFVAAYLTSDVPSGLLLGGLAMCEGMLALMAAAARASHALVPFALAQIGRTLALYIVFVTLVYLVPGEEWDVPGYLALRVGVLFLVLIAVLLSIGPRPAIDFARLTDAVRYGMPILVMSLLLLVMENVDRYFLGWHFDSITVGAYVVHVKLASVVGQGIIMPFSLWFAAERLRHMNAPGGGGAFFDRTALVLATACSAFAGATFVAGSFIVPILAPDAPFDPVVLGVVLLSTVAMGMTYALNIGLLKPGFTHLNVYPVMAGLAVVLLSGALLAPSLGPAGAAAARMLGTVIFLLVVAAWSQTIHPVPFRFGPIALIVAGSAFLALAIAPLVDGRGWLEVGFWSGLYLAAVVGLGWFANFVTMRGRAASRAR